MSEIRLTEDEARVVRAVLAELAVRTRTGELGILHGANRFVSTHLCLRKPDRESLHKVDIKLGLGKGVLEVQ